MRVRSFFVVALAAAARLSVPLGPLAVPKLCAGADGLEDRQERLRRIQQEISRKEREKQKTDRRARELANEVDRISKELQSARRAMEHTEKRLSEAEARRSAAETRLNSSRRSLGQWEERLAKALDAHYRRLAEGNEGGYVTAAYGEALLSHQVTSLGFAVEKHQDVVQLRDDLLSAEEQLRSLKLDKERDERRIASARERMRDLQKTTEGRRAVLEKEIRSLNASAKRFEKMIQDLISQERAKAAREAGRPKPVPAPSGTGEVARRWKGSLPWPVSGPVTERFGRTKHPELDTYLISNGVKVRPGAQDPVKAAAPGEVLFAGAFMNYGLMALVSHANDLHTIYAHLGKLNVQRGQKLAAGETVGLPGKDDEGRPMVYLELRANGTPVDPAGWFK